MYYEMKFSEFDAMIKQAIKNGVSDSLESWQWNFVFADVSGEIIKIRSTCEIDELQKGLSIQFSKSLYDKYLRDNGVNFLWRVYELVK